MNLWLKPDWDRGYEAGREAGLREAEECIIKLIESEVVLHQEQGLNASAHYLVHLIALIKGEK